MTLGYSSVGQRMLYPEDSQRLIHRVSCLQKQGCVECSTWQTWVLAENTSVRRLYTLELQGQITAAVLIPVNYFPQKQEPLTLYKWRVNVHLALLLPIFATWESNGLIVVICGLAGSPPFTGYCEQDPAALCCSENPLISPHPPSSPGTDSSVLAASLPAEAVILLICGIAMKCISVRFCFLFPFDFLFDKYFLLSSFTLYYFIISELAFII